jgi:hypothetical protein
MMMMTMNVEQSVEWELAAETEVLGEDFPQCHFVHHKSHTTWPGLEPGGKPATNRLSYGTAWTTTYIVINLYSMGSVFKLSQ